MEEEARSEQPFERRRVQRARPSVFCAHSMNLLRERDRKATDNCASYDRGCHPRPCADGSLQPGGPQATLPPCEACPVPRPGGAGARAGAPQPDKDTEQPAHGSVCWPGLPGVAAEKQEPGRGTGKHKPQAEDTVDTGYAVT